MPITLRERFARLGPVRSLDIVGEGSPLTVVVRPAANPNAIARVSIATALARRGIGMPAAKRAMEQLLEQGEVTLRLPTVESLDALAGDLRAAGCAVRAVDGTA